MVSPQMVKKIAFLCFDNFQLLDLSGPVDVFASAGQFIPDRYEICLLSKNGGETRSESGIAVTTEKIHDLSGFDSLIVVGGRGVFDAADDDQISDFVAGEAARLKRVVSICTGCFVLERAGLLNGKTVATHWQYIDKLKQSNQDVRIDADSLYVRDGDVITSAGVSAGMDLALSLVEEDWGRDVAMSVARDLVVYFHRPGSASQISELLKAQMLKNNQFFGLCAFIGENLREDLNVDALSSRMGMSPRNFSRRFKSDVGVPPAKFVEDVRLTKARLLLENGDDPIKKIADECGFGSGEGLSRVFCKRIGMSPIMYRERCRQRSDAP